MQTLTWYIKGMHQPSWYSKGEHSLTWYIKGMHQPSWYSKGVHSLTWYMQLSFLRCMSVALVVK